MELRQQKIIRSLERDVEIPIIALTAGSLAGEKEKCVQAGMNDFLAKSLLKLTMANMLKKWIGDEKKTRLPLLLINKKQA